MRGTFIQIALAVNNPDYRMCLKQSQVYCIQHTVFHNPTRLLEDPTNQTTAISSA
jgi:hypothetical protein